MSSAASARKKDELIENLRHVLESLSVSPYPHIPNPPECKKRASVALIIRINPSYSHWPVKANLDPSNPLRNFFQQDWVQYGDPEVLFIKRAARKGDRWTGHTALPGGGRETEDADDKAAAVRETMEEVGIDLNDENAIYVGNLPQRLVTTSWVRDEGKVPLMVLCAYVFVIKRHDMPPQRLQPTEIASTHWVPLRVLLSPAMRSSQYEDVSNRLAKQEFGIRRWFLRAVLGQMIFAAVDLIPSESRYCDPAGVLKYPSPRPSALRAVIDWIRPPAKPISRQRTEIHLWGLTLEVLADFLDHFPPHNALHLWAYPTFSPPDVKFCIWALSLQFRYEKLRAMDRLYADIPAQTDDVGLGSTGKTPNGHLSEIAVEDSPSADAKPPVRYTHAERRRRGSQASRVGFMLDGYWEIIQRGIAMALIGRATAIFVLFAYLWNRYKSLMRR